MMLLTDFIVRTLSDEWLNVALWFLVQYTFIDVGFWGKGLRMPAAASRLVSAHFVCLTSKGILQLAETMSIDTECYEQITLFLRAYSLPKVGTFRYEVGTRCQTAMWHNLSFSLLPFFINSPTCDAFAVIFRIDSHSKALVAEGFTVCSTFNIWTFRVLYWPPLNCSGNFERQRRPWLADNLYGELSLRACSRGSYILIMNTVSFTIMENNNRATHTNFPRSSLWSECTARTDAASNKTWTTTHFWARLMPCCRTWCVRTTNCCALTSPADGKRESELIVASFDPKLYYLHESSHHPCLQLLQTIFHCIIYTFYTHISYLR